MPRRSPLPPELKKAISDLSHAEKDKLLFRLLPKEPALVEKLNFELLDDGENEEERRSDLAKAIRAHLRAGVPHFYSPGYLLLDLRALSGDITRHVKTTKDKYGEVELTFLLLNEGIGPLRKQLAAATPGKARTLNDYVVKRTLKLFTLLEKLHPDYLIDFEDDMRKLGKNIGSIPSMMKTAIYSGLDVNYLLRAELP